MKPLILCLLLLFAVSPAIYSAARADGLAVTISPLNAEMNVAPGGNFTSVIAVTNDNPPGKLGDKSTARFKVYTTDWSLNREGAISFQQPGNAPDSCSSWIGINPVQVTVPAGTTQYVRFTVTVPSGAGGTYHTMLMFESIPDPNDAQRSAVAVNGRIGTALYVNVDSSAKRARITAFRAGAHSADITIQNTGTTILRLKGTLSICDAAGKTYETVQLPSLLILPGPDGTRHVSVDLPTPLTPGAFNATALIDFGGELLLGAKCSASVN